MSVLLLLGCQQSSQPPHKQEDKQLSCQDLEEAWQLLIGYDYVWSGDSFNNDGFDCSGAVYKVAKLVGKPVPRTTSKKYYLTNDYESKQWKDAKCGDLSWFTFNRPFGHLGQHITYNSFYHSGSSTGPTKSKFIKNKYWYNIYEDTKPFLKVK